MDTSIFGQKINVSDSGMYSATDLIKAGNNWLLKNGKSLFSWHEWRQSNNTREFIVELEKKYGTVIISGRGRGHHTWIYPFLFLDLALAINPKLKVEVYEWLFDKLLEYRNDSGDSFKEMTGALYNNCSNKSQFSKAMSLLCTMIKEECGIITDWQHAIEEQLLYRDKIHEYISLMCDILNGITMKLSVLVC
jgi:hypothetical protein